MNQRKQKDIAKMDALFREIGAGDFTPLPFSEAKELCGEKDVHKEFPFSDTCQKVIYPTEHEARKTILRRKKHGAGKLRIYRCEACAGFHLSSYISRL